MSIERTSDKHFLHTLNIELEKSNCLKSNKLTVTINKLMLTYKSYYNMAPPYLCELINKKESHVNTRSGTDQH